jgi:hypothetical protein
MGCTQSSDIKPIKNASSKKGKSNLELAVEINVENEAVFGKHDIKSPRNVSKNRPIVISPDGKNKVDL